ncbi:LacI family DNA-binding transcriptional regulator [Photobacterium sanctipauli]|uniref:LacI family DNA-binding transcriptional regulator n=1 Tax=Photobacterium sanctipauli TaxID=1342794 RepID=A0A2T3NP05_9GAMM|nr:substrate-binding domain-containing protein [Photobacterium sanctipauli]PSW18005.1 LacI family DNA-binding transcriptional regulator [Photobacterium sanctipauli]
MQQEQKKSRPTLQDIADRVGITKMTVSRYMRNPESVSAKTREKIAVVVEELGYIQNRAPAMLSKSSSKAIGVLLPSLSNQVFASFAQGIEAVTNAKGYETLIAHFSYDEEVEERKIASLLSYQVDGLILTGTSHTARTLQMIKTAGIPVVEAMELPDSPIDMVVGLDHVEASYTAVKAMIEKGKKHISYFGARLDTRTQLRMAGYDRAMDEAGLEKSHILTQEHSSFTLGGELLVRALEETTALDGVFCTNDDIAIGAILACKERGIQVPEQLSIVGYNALDIGQAISPRLTSVDTPRFEIGEKSAELLLSSIEGKPEALKVHDLGFTVTEGESL